MSNAYDAYKDVVVQLIKNLPPEEPITPENVFQEGVFENRKIIRGMVDRYLLPGSGVKNKENLIELFGYLQQGKSCLLLSEHYSNQDFLLYYHLFAQDNDLGIEYAESLLPIQGMKLSSNENSVTTPFTRSFDSIIIYPSRSLDKIEDPEKMAEVRKISTPINHAAIKALIHHKSHGRLIIVFPSGTRYRPWDPESKKGVREIDSYLKSFDYICCVGINGNILKPSPDDDMNKDLPQKDMIWLTCSPVYKGRQFRNQAIENTPEGVDPRQYSVDCIMNELEKIHEEMEPLRKEALKSLEQ